MRRKSFACFLLLLLLSACADDLWAVVTSDPGDDLIATENNEYIHHARWQAKKILPRTAGVGEWAVLDTSQARPALHNLPDRWSGPESRPGYCPDLLYTLMSLQR